jgi:hypothetical protein
MQCFHEEHAPCLRVNMVQLFESEEQCITNKKNRDDWGEEKSNHDQHQWDQSQL